ncbi:MAG TPA: N-acetylmuramoyl-L-alanine amidase, partial [Myxococcales bacterium]
LAELENGGPGALPAPKVTDAVSGILADLALGQARNDSAALAEIIQRQVVRGTHAPSRGVRQAPFLVLSGTKMPSALVEIGFISHPQESKLLARPAYQEKVAAALASAVREFADKVLSRRLVAQSGRPSGAEPAVATERSTAVNAVATGRTPAANAVSTTPGSEVPAAVPVARPGGTR